MAPFLDGVQLSQGYRATTRRQFTICHLVPRKSWYSFDRHWNNERLNRTESLPAVLIPRPLDWKFSAAPLGHCSVNFILRNPQLSTFSKCHWNIDKKNCQTIFDHVFESSLSVFLWFSFKKHQKMYFVNF